MKVDVGWGQCENACSQFITNDDLDLNSDIPNPILPVPALQATTSFQNGWVNGWFVSHGSPHHIQFDPNYNGPFGHCILTWQVMNGNEVPCFIPSGVEGMFTTINLASLDDFNIFCLNFDVTTIDCFNSDIEINFIVSLTNELVALLPDEYPNIPKPLIFQEEILFNEIINTRGSTHYTTSFIPSQLPNYDQLWFYGQNVEDSPGSTPIQFHNINLSCTTTSLTDIITCHAGTSVSFESVNESNDHPFTEFKWFFGDGQTSILATPTHTFSTPGSYDVCLEIKNNIGCCSKFCKQIQVYHQLIDIQTNFCSSYTFSIENPDPSMTYTWSIPGGSPSTGSGTIFSTMITQNGTYTVSVTGQNACHSVSSSHTFEVQCSSEPPSCTNQTNCVFIGTDINSVTRLSDLITGNNPVIPSIQIPPSYIINNLCFSVEGKLIIDIPEVSFINTNWYMGPGAEIEIAPVVTFGSRWFADSHFQACTLMWRGIVVKANAPGTIGNGGLSLIRSTIEDAWRGVELENNTVLSASLSNFFDNYIGIYTTPRIGNKNKIVAELSNNLFEDKESMLPPYSGQPDYSSRFHTGISINNCDNFIIGNSEETKNTFKNLLTGIHSNNSSHVNSQGNTFEDTYVYPQHLTRGIFLERSGSLSYISNKNKFINLNIGVEVTGSNGQVNINDNTFINNRTNPSFFYDGIRSHINESVNLIFSNNTFDFSSGKCIYHNGSATSIYINENTPILRGLGPYFLFQQGTNSTSRIFGNTVSFPEGARYYGYVFYFMNCQKVNAYDNTILSPNSFIADRNTSGFLLRGCTKSLFRNNVIEIQSRAFNVTGAEKSEDIAYCCNQANNTVPGAGIFEASFYLSSTKGQSFVRQNDLRILRLLGEISPQKNAGNNWTAGSLAVLDNPTPFRIQQNAFLFDETHTATKPSPDNYDPPSLEGTWFLGNGTEHPTCTTTPNCNLPPYYLTSGDTTIFKFLPDPDPSDTVIIIVDPARPHCSVVQNLYQRIMLVDSISDPLEYWYLVTSLERWRAWQGDAWFSACLGAIYEYNPDVDIWNDTEKDKDGIRNFDENIRSAANQLMEDITLIAEELSIYELDSLLRLDSIAIVRYNELYILNAQLDSLLETVSTEIGNRAADLIPIVQALPTPLPFLNDKKTVWLAELKILSDGITSLDSADWNAIRVIAEKCPELYGQSVFLAQTLLGMIGEFIETDSSCTIVKIRSKEKIEKQESVLVTPNPGSGIFNFETSGDRYISAISIFNVSGVKVHETKILDRSGQNIIDISGFVPGIYFYEVKTGENKIEKGKLIKI